jgi:hypothetical protein
LLMSVSVKPGATAFTVIWRLPRSHATVRVKVLIAPFGRRVHGPHRAGEIGCCRRYIDDCVYRKPYSS